MPRYWQVAHPPEKPLLAYDGDCSFCRRWIARWQQITGPAIDYQTYQSVLLRFPEIPEDQFAQGVKLIEPDGTVTSSAQAVFRALELAGQKRWLLRLYDNFFPFTFLSESVYTFIAHHRGGLDRVDRYLLGKETLRPTYFLTRDLFLRCLGVVYLIAFFQYYLQADGLIGSHGILPVAPALNVARAHFPSALDAIATYWRFPTLLWLANSDRAIHVFCWLGIISSCFIILGLARVFFLSAAWLIYLSLVTVDQVFLSFQWDALLLESGFVAIFLAPWQFSWRLSCEFRVGGIALWLQRWLLFRLMFLSGLVKITWGDVTWKSWEVLRLHYETQPLPIWTSWYIDKAPAWFQWVSLIFMWIAELGAPFLIFGPSKMRLRAFFLIVLLQLLIAATGNYGFFNLMTIVLCITLLDYAQLNRRWRAGLSAQTLAAVRRLSCFPLWVTAPLALFVLFITSIQIVEAVHGNPILYGRMQWPDFVTQLRIPAEGQLRSVNSYGLFRVMTKTRNEIIIEGSDDNDHWKEYQFKFKPGPLNRRPQFCTPLMPRLDWQMWFAALGDLRDPGNQWFITLMVRLLQGRPEVLNLLDDNPFPDHPPRFIRALLYRYQFTTEDERRATGNWWKRDLVGLYCPIIRSDQIQDPKDLPQ